MRLTIFIFSIVFFVSCGLPNKEQSLLLHKTPDLLDISFVPHQPFPEGQDYHTGFSDKGAWFGYYLPSEQDAWGGFTGPWIIAGEYPVYLAEKTASLKIKKQLDDGSWVACPYKENPTMHYYPGMLVQELITEDFVVSVKLSYVNAGSTVISYEIFNESPENKLIELAWHGRLLPYKDDLVPVAHARGIDVHFKGIKEKWNYFSDPEMCFSIWFNEEINVHLKENEFEYSLKEPRIVNSKGFTCITQMQSFTFTSAEKGRLKAKESISDAQKIHAANEKRWEKLGDRLIDRLGAEDKNLAAGMKALITLNTNRRAPAGRILTEGIVPGTFYKWFNGIWAWDSWKQSAGIAPYMPETARNNIRSMFDYQISANNLVRPEDEGMIPDCIFFYNDEEGSGNWNERNSKPPLASWAVWKIFENTRDTAFVEEMLPLLEKYHAWWYANRDHDGNGICEYGATVHPLNVKERGVNGGSDDHRIEAAAWESGGDNSIRFDAAYGVEMLENYRDGKLVGYSLNQESVDLNAFLVAEKRFLVSMNKLLGFNEKVRLLDREADLIENFIRQKMYHEASGYFYDVDIENKRPLVKRGKGPEGWIVLWAGIATSEQAEKVKEAITDPDQFNTFVPFPTASKANPRFNANGYWRGPVWMSPAWFGLKGLLNYGYDEQAQTMAFKVLENAEGLTKPGESIRENYNPLSGEGLSCNDFSWSAAHLLMMLEQF